MHKYIPIAITLVVITAIVIVIVMTHKKNKQQKVSSRRLGFSPGATVKGYASKGGPLLFSSTLNIGSGNHMAGKYIDPSGAVQPFYVNILDQGGSLVISDQIINESNDPNENGLSGNMTVFNNQGSNPYQGNQTISYFNYPQNQGTTPVSNLQTLVTLNSI